jgi:hypothetical protein
VINYHSPWQTNKIAKGIMLNYREHLKKGTTFETVCL